MEIRHWRGYHITTTTLHRPQRPSFATSHYPSQLGRIPFPLLQTGAHFIDDRNDSSSVSGEHAILSRDAHAKVTRRPRKVRRKYVQRETSRRMGATILRPGNDFPPGGRIFIPRIRQTSRNPTRGPIPSVHPNPRSILLTPRRHPRTIPPL